MAELALSGVVLAGGVSRRMGMDKRFLTLAGKPLLAWVLERLQPLVAEVTLVATTADDFAGWEVRVTTDRYPGCGVLAGLHAGLTEARGAWALVVAGDMPLLNADLIRALWRLAQSSSADVIVPEWRGELEPLHALYRTATCAPAAEAALLAGQRRMVAFYSQVRVQILPAVEVARWDPAGLSFFNINTVADLETAQRHLERSAQSATEARSAP